jgi:hypothetical protein
MSRRHRDRGHGRSHHRPPDAAQHGAASPRAFPSAIPTVIPAADPRTGADVAKPDDRRTADDRGTDSAADHPSPTHVQSSGATAHEEASVVLSVTPRPPVAVAEPVAVAVDSSHLSEAAEEAGVSEQGASVSGDPAPRMNGTCSPAQLRRFIKSRPWIPMHELRRRFAINGTEDEVTLLDVEGSSVFVGLPEREGRILADLLRAGEVGFELSHDPATPIIVGVYPMRPVPRL